MDDLLRLAELADRCEIERAGRELDADISMALFPWIARGEDGRFYRRVGGPYDGIPVRILHYTTSLDDAMTLVPEGYGWSLYSDGYAGCAPYDPEQQPDGVKCGETPALALCAAALRSRASVGKGE